MRRRGEGANNNHGTNGQGPSLFQETSFTDHVARRVESIVVARWPGWRRCDGSINDRFPAIVQVYRLPYHCQQVPDLRYPPTYASISGIRARFSFFPPFLSFSFSLFFSFVFVLSSSLHSLSPPLFFSSSFLSFHFPLLSSLFLSRRGRAKRRARARDQFIFQRRGERVHSIS